MIQENKTKPHKSLSGFAKKLAKEYDRYEQGYNLDLSLEEWEENWNQVSAEAWDACHELDPSTAVITIGAAVHEVTRYRRIKYAFFLAAGIALGVCCEKKCSNDNKSSALQTEKVHSTSLKLNK